MDQKQIERLSQQLASSDAIVIGAGAGLSTSAGFTYPEDTHVGIVGGRDENGNLLIVHCASGANNVVITGLEGFTSIGRPLYYGE